jgi:hypothetical protein
MKKSLVPIWISEEHLTQLDSLSAKLGRRRADVIEDAIAVCLDMHRSRLTGTPR